LENLTYRQGCGDLSRDNWLTPEQQPHLLNNSQFERADLVLGSLSSSGLKTLWLEYTPISYQILLQVLEKHADTLTDLRIAHTCLRDGTWAEVFSSVKKTCRFLNRLVAEDLSQARPDVRDHEYRPLVLPTEWTLDTYGRARVEEALEKLLVAPSLETLDMMDRSTRVHNIDFNHTIIEESSDDEMEFVG
jgi:hypothetical protein